MANLACHGGVASSVQCDKVLQLTLGQSPAQVEALLGRPFFAGETGAVWANGQDRIDFTMIYGSSQSGTEVFVGSRDELHIDFLRGRLVEITAYRMYLPLRAEKYDRTAIMLGSRDYGVKSEPFYEIGPAFADVFRCAPGFSRERAQAEFEARNRRSHEASR